MSLKAGYKNAWNIHVCNGFKISFVNVVLPVSQQVCVSNDVEKLKKWRNDLYSFHLRNIWITELSKAFDLKSHQKKIGSNRIIRDELYIKVPIATFAILYSFDVWRHGRHKHEYLLNLRADFDGSFTNRLAIELSIVSNRPQELSSFKAQNFKRP